MTIDSVPRGPGLYAMTREGAGRAITNVRKLAGGQGRPGQGLINTATILLGMLAAGLFAVSLAAQYQYIWHAKHQGWPAVIEAVALDAGMAIFSLLALGLARAGQSARIERALIVVCACGSAAMNYAAADVTSPRSVLAYTMPPVFLAIVADRVIASVRRHVLGMDAGRSAWATLGRAALAVLAVFGKAMLYSLRFVLAPRSTFAGLRRCVLIAAPLPPSLAGLAGPDSGTGGGREEQPWPMCLLKTGPDGTGKVCSRPRPCPRHEPQVPLPGETKKAHLRRLYAAHPRCGDQPSASRIAAELAPHVRLGEGTARAYIYQFLAEQQETP